MKTLITKENLRKLYKSMESTAKNIINILSCIETNTDEIKTFRFFKKFIKKATNEIQLKCLRFFTGADIIIQKKKSKWNLQTLLACAPVAHICSGVLEFFYKYKYFANF